MKVTLVFCNKKQPGLLTVKTMSIERLELSRLLAREPKSRASTKFRHMDKFIKIAVTRLELARFSAIDFESTSYSEFRHTAKMHQERFELS